MRQELESITVIAEETWDRFVTDGAPLFQEHHAEAGEIEHLPFDPNYPVGAFLAQRGMLRTYVARAGDEMIGYVVFLLDVSAESRHVLIGTLLPMFVRRAYRDHRRIGIRLLDHAIGELRLLGVKRLVLRSGVRASGPKLAALFQRMGAVEDGRQFTLWIGD